MSLELFTHRVLPLKDKLFRFACRLLQNAAEAEDAVQDVMVKIWAKRGEWDRWENLEGYCMTSMRNHCLERLRSRRGRYVEVEALAGLPGAERDPSQVLLDREVAAEIRKSMEALPEKQYLVMQLREVEGLTYQEIAGALDLSMEQVKVYLHRARTAVKNTLWKI